MAKHDMVQSLVDQCSERANWSQQAGWAWRGERGAHKWSYAGGTFHAEWIKNERGRLGGCRCGLCGKTYLWRQSLADYEVYTGGVEDPVTMDKIIVASGDDYDPRYGGNLNLQRRLSDGRSNADLIRCTLCYEARCASCEQFLQFQD